MIIAIDFDGTIVEHRFPLIGEPIKGALETIKRLQEAGHKLILWTCRNDIDPANNGKLVLSEAIAFLKFHEIEFDAINSNAHQSINPTPKVYADFYVDDRAFPFVKPETMWDMLNQALDNPTSILNKPLIYF